MADEKKHVNPTTGEPMTEAQKQQLLGIAQSPSEDPPPGVDPDPPRERPEVVTAHSLWGSGHPPQPHRELLLVDLYIFCYAVRKITLTDESPRELMKLQ